MRLFFCAKFSKNIKGGSKNGKLGQVASLIISIIYFTRTKTFKIKLNSFKVDMGLLGNVIISLVCNIMLSKYGALSKYGKDIPIAVMGICMKVFTIVINIVVGIILGAQPILGYNFGAKKIDRVKQTYKLTLISTIIVGLISTLIFEFCPEIVIRMFGTESDLYMEFAVLTFRIFLLLVTFTCTIKMTSIFFKAVGTPLKAAIVSLTRDIVCFVPVVIIFPKFIGIKGALWAAPIADVVGMIISTILVIVFFKTLNKVDNVQNVEQEVIKESKEGIIITIARQHGTQGKYIGKLVADKLGIPYYYKEMTAIAAQENGLDREFIDKINRDKNILRELYLTTAPVKYAIQAQEKAINMIADKGACVIVGRAADYVLRNRKNVVKIFIYAPEEYRIQRVKEMYLDDENQAKKNIENSDKNRASYYKMVSSKNWGEIQNYDLCIDSSIGKEKTAEFICEYIRKLKD